MNETPVVVPEQQLTNSHTTGAPDAAAVVYPPFSLAHIDRFTAFATGTLIFLLALELLLLLLYRRINLDEGWYLNAARLVYTGKQLYSDFAYTQTPLLPYVYGLFQQLFGVGLYQGRILTVLLAGGAWLMSAATARRLGGGRAGLICLALIATSFFATTQYTYTATYALTAYLLATAFYVALLDWPCDLRNALATLLICLAVATRLSTVVALPPFLLYLWLSSEKRGRAFVVIGLTTLLTLGLLLGSFWLRSGDLMLYDIWGFHLDRILRTRWRLLKIQNRVLRTGSDFAVPILFCMWAGVWAGRQLWRNWRLGLTTRIPAATLTMTLVVAGLFVAHLVPRTTDSYYNALQLPLMAVAGSVVVAQQLARLGERGHSARQVRWSWVIWLLMVALAVNGGQQLRAIIRDGALTDPLQNQVAVVRRAAAIVQQYVPADQPILTFNQHLALEAKRETPPGYEMAIFAYRPTWDVAQAEHYKVINNELLLRDLARPFAAAAFTEFDLEQIYGERDAFFATLAANYRWFYTIPYFGPYGDTLYLYVPPQFTVQQPPIVYPTTFADGIQLLGYEMAEDLLNGEPVLTVGLHWQANAMPSQPYTVFVQLLDQDGVFVTGFDNPPCHRTCPTDRWQPGEFLRDEYHLPLAGLARSKSYQLQIGLYDADGTRLDVIGGPFAGEDRVILQDVALE